MKDRYKRCVRNLGLIIKFNRWYIHIDHMNGLLDNCSWPGVEWILGSSLLICRRAGA
jgi:hypothetical protein